MDQNALVMWAPDGRRTLVELSTEPVWVGADDHCDLKLTEPGSPLRLLRLYPAGRGWAIEQVDDSAEVLLDGTPLAGETQLEDGATLEVCGYRLQIWLEGSGREVSNDGPKATPNKLSLLPVWQIPLMLLAILGVYFLMQWQLGRFKGEPVLPLPSGDQNLIIQVTVEELLARTGLSGESLHLVPVMLAGEVEKAGEVPVYYDVRSTGKDKAFIVYLLSQPERRILFELERDGASWKIVNSTEEESKTPAD